MRLPTTATAPFCPSAVQGSVQVPACAPRWRRRFAFAGSGLLVAVGYMDPGNWATDIAAGSRYGYALLSVILFSSLIAMFLQGLCVRLGLATGLDLAQHCRESFSGPTRFVLWLFAEVAIIACDLAEVLGTALAIFLLTGVPLSTGVLLTALDTVFVLALQGRGFRRLEAIILGLVATIALCFAFQVALAHPLWGQVAAGFIPNAQVFSEREAWYLAIGILGATVMPHNLYLHSAIVQTRKVGPSVAEQREAISFTTWDSSVALAAAFLVNAAILILAASAFHAHGETRVTEIEDAHRLLTPLLGTGLASAAFAIALFAAGQSSTLTGTIAGQVVLEGFWKLKIPCWQRRLITRVLAVVPAWIGIMWLGEGGLGRMLIASQVVLSMQLPFAVAPLIWFTASRRRMGDLAVPGWVAAIGWTVCVLILAANAWMVLAVVSG